MKNLMCIMGFHKMEIMDKLRGIAGRWECARKECDYFIPAIEWPKPPDRLKTKEGENKMTTDTVDPPKRKCKAIEIVTGTGIKAPEGPVETVSKVFREIKAPEGIIEYTNFAEAREAFFKRNMKIPETKFYQTEYAQETIAIIEDPDGSISIGIARAGKDDDKNRRVSPEEGMRIAEGRAIKARTTKVPLIKKNYLRGIHAMKVEA